MAARLVGKLLPAKQGQQTVLPPGAYLNHNSKSNHKIVGRPHSRLTRATATIRERWVIEGNRTPLEVMLRNMQYYDTQASELMAKTGAWTNKPKDDAERKARLSLLKSLSGARINAQACAVDAAPYMHQKIATLTLGNGDGKPFRITLESGEELL